MSTNIREILKLYRQQLENVMDNKIKKLYCLDPMHGEILKLILI